MSDHVTYVKKHTAFIQELIHTGKRAVIAWRHNILVPPDVPRLSTGYPQAHKNLVDKGLPLGQ